MKIEFNGELLKVTFGLYDTNECIVTEKGCRISNNEQHLDIFVDFIHLDGSRKIQKVRMNERVLWERDFCKKELEGEKK